MAVRPRRDLAQPLLYFEKYIGGAALSLAQAMNKVTMLKRRGGYPDYSYVRTYVRTYMHTCRREEGYNRGTWKELLEELEMLKKHQKIEK